MMLLNELLHEEDIYKNNKHEKDIPKYFEGRIWSDYKILENHVSDYTVDSRINQIWNTSFLI